MSRKPLVAVVGATGAQGGGLARAILADPERHFNLRAITRTPSSEAARRLAAHGAEVVAADCDDAQSLELAFRGATAAFCVTNYWEHHCPHREREQARKLAEAAAVARVEHVIWSTLEDTRRWIPLSDRRMPTLRGEFKVPHMDAKGEANAYFIERNVPTTFLLTSFYWENFFGMGPQRGPDGKLAITFPMGDKALPGICVEDIGRCAFGVLKNRAEWVGKTLGVAGEHLTGVELAQQLGTALGEDVGYNAIPPAVYRSLGFPGADDLGNMFQFKHDFNTEFCAARPVAVGCALNPQLQDFSTWLRANVGRIPHKGDSLS